MKFQNVDTFFDTFLIGKIKIVNKKAKSDISKMIFKSLKQLCVIKTKKDKINGRYKVCKDNGYP